MCGAMLRLARMGFIGWVSLNAGCGCWLLPVIIKLHLIKHVVVLLMVAMCLACSQ